MRFPGGAALNCWGGGAAETASSEKADGSLVAKVNLFYNGGNTVVKRQPNVRADSSWEHAPDSEPDDHQAQAVETGEKGESS